MYSLNVSGLRSVFGLMMAETCCQAFNSADFICVVSMTLIQFLHFYNTQRDGSY
jgi:hypothetical protein